MASAKMTIADVKTNMDTKIEPKLKKQIVDTLDKAFPYMSERDVKLLDVMFETVHLNGINRGLKFGKAIIDEAIKKPNAI